MAKYVHGINGPLAGSLGNLVASNWRGIPYLKTKPKRKKAFTGNELRNQGSFGMTTQWLRPLTDHLRAGFKGENPKKWGFNGAKSYLHAHALIREGNSKVIDPSKVLISQGYLPLGTEFEMHFDEETFEVTVRWNTQAPRARKGAIAAAGDDKLMLAVYDPVAGEVFGEPYGVSRKRGMEQVELPLGLVATYHVYVAFVAADGSSRSDSLYLGAIRVGEEEEGEEGKPETKQLFSDQSKHRAEQYWQSDTSSLRQSYHYSYSYSSGAGRQTYSKPVRESHKKTAAGFPSGRHLNT